MSLRLPSEWNSEGNWKGKDVPLIFCPFRVYCILLFKQFLDNTSQLFDRLGLYKSKFNISHIKILDKCNALEKLLAV